MILTDGTTTFSYVRGEDYNSEINLERAEATTAGGLVRVQVSGKRLLDRVRVRLTESEYLSLNNLLDQPSANISYTPDEIPGFMSQSDFPLLVSVNSPKIVDRAWNGAIYYYVELEIKSMDFI